MTSTSLLYNGQWAQMEPICSLRKMNGSKSMQLIHRVMRWSGGNTVAWQDSSAAGDGQRDLRGHMEAHNHRDELGTAGAPAGLKEEAAG
jgi:hypothetical protein